MVMEWVCVVVECACMVVKRALHTGGIRGQMQRFIATSPNEIPGISESECLNPSDF